MFMWWDAFSNRQCNRGWKKGRGGERGWNSPGYILFMFLLLSSHPNGHLTWSAVTQMLHVKTCNSPIYFSLRVTRERLFPRGWTFFFVSNTNPTKPANASEWDRGE